MCANADSPRCCARGPGVAWVGELSILIYTVANMIARPIIIGDYVTEALAYWCATET